MDSDVKKILTPILFIALLVVMSSLLLFILTAVEGRPASLLQCLYMVAITISTIGYEDMIGTRGSTVLTVVNIALIFTFMLGVAYAVSNFTAYLIEGRLSNYFRTKRTQKRIGKMDNHYIICGIKDIGIFVAKELNETKREFVVVDDSAHAIEALRKDLPAVIAVEGDPTADEVLAKAGITKAKALIAALENDKENLYLVVAAKDLNPGITIASKYNNPATRHKFVNAGAASLVSPSMIGGMRIASELVRPQTVSFLDRMLRGKKDTSRRVEEIQVPQDSAFVGRTLGELHKETGVLVISYKVADRDDYDYNPKPGAGIEPGMTLLFIVTPNERMLIEKKVAQSA